MLLFYLFNFSYKFMTQACFTETIFKNLKNVFEGNQSSGWNLYRWNEEKQKIMYYSLLNFEMRFEMVLERYTMHYYFHRNFIIPEIQISRIYLSKFWKEVHYIRNKVHVIKTEKHFYDLFFSYICWKKKKKKMLK